ncbi:MAG: sensor histidine kinase [Lachnospiraceae bacterium]
MRKNNRYILLFFLSVLAVWAGFSFVPQPELVELPTTYGSYDLIGYDFENTVYRTADYWESWPEALYTPSDLADGIVPDFRFVERQEYKSITHATHRLLLTLPAGQTYGISMLTSEYAMRIYVDGAEIDSVGIPGDTRESTEHRSLEKVYYFTPQSDTVQILIQTSNFVHDKGGAWPPTFTIGTAQNISQRNNASIAVSFLIVGCLLMASLYHLGLYCLNRNRKTVLLFSVCCLLLALLNKKLILLFWPDYVFDVAIRMEYVLHFLAFAALVLFLEKLHPRLLNQRVTRCYYALAGLYVLTTLLLDTRIFTGLIKYFEGVSLLIIAYVLVRLAMALREGKMLNYLSFTGVLVLGLLSANDVLYYRGVVLIPPVAGQFFMAPIGMVFFVFCYALALSVEYAQTERAMRDAQEKRQQLATENAALDRVNRLKTELMSTISHEARTPLAVLASYAGLVSMELKEKGADVQTTADLDKIAFEAKRVAGLIDSMKQLTLRSEKTARRVGLDFSEIISQTAGLYRHILERSGVALHLRIEEDLPPVYGSPEELTQVVFNLLQNAKNYTLSGEVIISAGRDGAFLSACVTDTGSGIAPELLPHVFERGVSGGNGSGLGLAICKEIVGDHGGSIEVTSEQGKGTTVLFTLPLYKEGIDDGA